MCGISILTQGLFDGNFSKLAEKRETTLFKKLVSEHQTEKINLKTAFKQ